MSCLVLDTLACGKGVWSRFVTDTRQSALELDALQSSHAVELPINDTTEASRAYDNMSYMKGVCLLRMISHFLGQTALEEAVQAYMAKYYQQTVTPDYFWICLERSSKWPVR